jgi:hypothetical protein
VPASAKLSSSTAVASNTGEEGEYGTGTDEVWRLWVSGSMTVSSAAMRILCWLMLMITETV